MIPVLFLAVVVNLICGSVYIEPSEIFRCVLNPESVLESTRLIIMEYRFPKSVIAILAGGSLAVSGLVLQGWFRNPLAGPYVLGVSSGAGLGVAIFFMLGFSFFLGEYGAALLGSAVILFLLLWADKKVSSKTTLLIIGLMMGIMASALIGFLQYFSEAIEVKKYVLWTMGSLGGVGWRDIFWVTPVVLIGVLILLVNSKSLNALLPGERYAQTVGVNVGKTRKIMLLGCTLLTGSITAVCGPLAFVGMSVPHMIHPIMKTTSYQRLIPACFLAGAILLLVCDTIAQLPFLPAVMPINGISSLIGAPIVLYVIIKMRAE